MLGRFNPPRVASRTGPHVFMEFMAKPAVNVRREIVHLAMKLLSLETESFHAARILSVHWRWVKKLRFGSDETMQRSHCAR